MQPIVSIDAHKDTCTDIVEQGPELAKDATRIPSAEPAIARLAENHPDALFLA